MSRPAIARINCANLRHNYRTLVDRARGARLMAVVKANAYGHGLHIVAPALLAAGCRQFAVTDVAEGAALRDILGQGPEIVVLSGIFDTTDARLSARHRLIPVVFTMKHVHILHAAAYAGPVWLKADTGMQRLGADDPAELMQACTDHALDIAGIMSHLACADLPEHPLNQKQAARFREILGTLPQDTPASLLNSAGLACMPEHNLDVVRPGIALYGIEPAEGIALGLKPVMQLTGSVMQIRDVPKNTSISYGASYVAGRAMRIAVVSLGYADGLPRALSNRGCAVWQGNRLPIVGRVCMDYCLLDISSQALACGEEVEFWGEDINATEVANLAGTITYEIFTGVGHRVRREAA